MWVEGGGRRAACGRHLVFVKLRETSTLEIPAKITRPSVKLRQKATPGFQAYFSRPVPVSPLAELRDAQVSSHLNPTLIVEDQPH